MFHHTFNIHVLNETLILWSPHLLGSSEFWDISWFKQFEFNRIILKDFEIMSPFNPHSWAKFKIALVRKLGRKFYYRHSSFKVVFMPGKNRVKGKPCYRRRILVLKPKNGDYESSKSTFSQISKKNSLIFYQLCHIDRKNIGSKMKMSSTCNA